MIWDTYEISLWTHNDIFLSVLAQSGDLYRNGAYNPVLKMSTNGEVKLTFTIPVVIYNKETGQLEDNSLWYNQLRNDNSLANEKRVKCIFNKGQQDETGKYTHTIIETVIVNLTERREGLQIFCDVECTGLAFKWLGKIGYQITLDSETVLLEEEKDDITVYPNINYWLDKVFPKDAHGNWATKWGYEIRMNYAGMGQTKNPAVVYEDNDIISWTQDATSVTPVYSDTPIEKRRFLTVSESNKYNITQDIAELFEVFVRYEFLYENPLNPYKITRGMAVFYNELPDYTEYAITFKDNEVGLTRTSDSNDVVTKLYVRNVESENADDGYVSIANAPNNVTKDTFILNFDYYIRSGQLSNAQINAIPQYERDIRAINIRLEDAITRRNELESAIADMEVEVSTIQDKITAAQSNINDYNEKMSAIDGSLSTSVLTDKKIACLTSNQNGATIITFRRAGVIANSIVIETEGVRLVRSIFDPYGCVTGIEVVGIAPGKICYVTYDYDLLGYYRNETETYTSARNALQEKLTLQKNRLGDEETHKPGTLYGQLTEVKDLIDELGDTKNSITLAFENLMGFFLKEGYWSTDDYEAPAEKKSRDNCSIFYDSTPMEGEQLSYYLYGIAETRKYYDYIIADSFRAFPIEDLVIIEAWNTGGTEYTKQYLYNAQYTPQFMNIDGQTSYVLLFNENITLSSGHRLYYTLDGTTRTDITPLYRDGDTHHHNLVYRRYRIDNEDNVITNSIEIAMNGIKLDEFYDYTVYNNKGTRIITFKCNAHVPPSSSLRFNLGYKCDRTTTQFFYDAQSVSRNSAFPVASYDVSFTYLRNSIKHAPYIYPSDYLLFLNTSKNQVYLATNELFTKESIRAQRNINDSVNLRLGSIVRINDHQMNFKGVKGIVSEFSFNLDKPEETHFVIKNYKTRFEDLFGRIVASTEQMKNNSISYNRAADAILPTQQILGSILQNTITNNNLVYNSGVTSGVYFDEYGIVVETTFPYANGVTGQLLLRGGAILLSDSVDADGNRIYTTGITPAGINASVITAGRLDTEKINIYSGDQVRFAWTAEGLNAYGQNADGSTDFFTYVKYNQDGIVFEQNDFKAVELGWNGLYLGAQDGSVEITGSDGLSMYNGPTGTAGRQRMLHVGRVDNGGQWVYGFRLYNDRGQETLITNNEGELWLKRTLTVGESATGMVGITGEGIPSGLNDPIRIWAGSTAKMEAPFIVYESGKIKATSADITGTINATDGSFTGTISAKSGDIGGWVIEENALSSGNVKLSSVAPSKDDPDPKRIEVGDTFYLTNDGKLYARGANIEGTITANAGFIGGWQIDQNVIYSGNMRLSSAPPTAEIPNPERINVNNAFTVTDDGALVATNATINGNITAVTGDIGGWHITQYGLEALSEAVGLYAGNKFYYSTEDVSPIRFWANRHPNDEGWITYEFAVTNEGTLYANKAKINGEIIAQSGYIANIFRVGTAESGIIMSAVEPGNSFIGSAQYASGALGYGWRLDENGDASFNNLSARGRIEASVFEYNRISAVGGNLYVAPTIYSSENSTKIQKTASTVSEASKYPWTCTWMLGEEATWISGSGSFSINGRTWLLQDELKIDGDLLLLNTNGDIVNSYSMSDVNAKIYSTKNTSAEHSFTIIFDITSIINSEKYPEVDIKSLDLSNYVFAKGTVLILYGTQNHRQGLYLSACGDGSPFMDIYDAAADEGSPMPVVRLGNLSGITDGYFTNGRLEGYGLYSTNAYLRGQLMLPNAGITNQNAIMYEDSPIRLWAGRPENVDDITQANFIVTENGYMYAKQGVFEGKVIAHEGEFSGTIQAAGVLLKSREDNSPNGHFFVTYPIPEGEDRDYGPEDYVINIDSQGISVWEGALRAFSDYASGENPAGIIDPIYGYRRGRYENPVPYFTLVDDGIVDTDGQVATLDCHCRIAATRAHFCTIESNVSATSNYSVFSTIVDNGIWFNKFNYLQSATQVHNIESIAFNTPGRNGMTILDDMLSLEAPSGLIFNTTKTIFVNSTTEDRHSNPEQSLYIRGKVKIINTDTTNTLSMGDCDIQEAKDADGKSVGLNFMIL